MSGVRSVARRSVWAIPSPTFLNAPVANHPVPLQEPTGTRPQGGTPASTTSTLAANATRLGAPQRVMMGERIAPTAATGDVLATLTVRCVPKPIPSVEPGRTALWPLKSIYGPSLEKIFLFLESLQPEPIDPRLSTAPLLSAFKCQDEPAPNSSAGSKPAGPLPGPTGCAPSARAPETHACPTPAKQNEEITLRRTVSVRKRLGARAASGRSSIPPVTRL